MTSLAAHHVGGAARILPVTFLVIVATVAIYGLTAVPVARRLHVTRPARTRPLLVGGDPWVIALARTLRTAGLDVIMWAASDEQRGQIKQANLELMPGELLAAATSEGGGTGGSRVPTSAITAPAPRERHQRTAGVGGWLASEDG